MTTPEDILIALTTGADDWKDPETCDGQCDACVYGGECSQLLEAENE